MHVCRFHADRPAVGVCMRCRRPICAACVTRLDGVNHCHVCLKALGRREAAPARSRSAAPTAALMIGALAAGWVFLALIGFALIEGKLAP
jgi:hypothetical protein